MTDSVASTLALRFRAPRAETPDLYPVDVSINGQDSSLRGAVSIRAGDFSGLEARGWDYGSRLGQAVFNDRDLQRALAYAQGPGKPVSLSIRIDDEVTALHDLMWERLTSLVGPDEIVFAKSDKIAFSRQIPREIPTVQETEGPFRLLLFIASPVELDELPDNTPTPPIDMATEIGRLKDAWRPLVQGGLMHVSIIGRVPEKLAAELEADGYTIAAGPATLEALADRLSSVDSLHLISHGSYKNGTASLLLEDSGGHMKTVTEEEFLGKFGTALRLVFLQACKSAARTPGTPNVMSGLAPKLARHAQCVVAMQDFVRVQDASRFAQEFYDSLLSTGFADVAANAGRNAIYSPENSNWAIPAVYLTSKLGQPLWEPDAVLRAIQTLAQQFAGKPDVTNPFPVDVIRQTPEVSSRMETSPPGPRVRVLEAVSSALFPEDGERSPIVVIAGNYGRAKTAQLYRLYELYARQASRRDVVPFFTQISDFQSFEDTPEQTLALAISSSYKRQGIDVQASAVIRRLKQKFILCLDGDLEADSRRRDKVFEYLQQITDKNPGASAIVTLDEQLIEQTSALKSNPRQDGEDGNEHKQIPVLLVQLLSPAGVAQYLTGLGDDCKGLLGSLQRANLFDLATVPWLLSYLIRHANRGGLSRSSVIERIIGSNFASANVPPGIRRIVNDLLSRMAWALQTRQAPRLDGGRVYEIMDEVRGRREVGLEQLKTLALATQIVTAVDEDSIRFSYPGFQSYCCAQYLKDSGAKLYSHIDDITATLGRRSRVRHWEDTLVLLAGMMDTPERLVERIVAGSSMSYGEQAFLAARCIHEAGLAGHAVGPQVRGQVLDALIWRSTPMKESSASVRVRAIEALALLNDKDCIPHLVSQAIGRVRPRFNDTPTFELSGLRHAALQVLLTMQEETDAYLRRGDGTSAMLPETRDAIGTLIGLWREGNCDGLQELFRSATKAKLEGLPAVIAFVLGTAGGRQNLKFLIDALLDPSTADDAQWSIVDSLLSFDPGEVTSQAVTKLRQHAALHTQAAYIIGKLRIAERKSEEVAFLVSCLKADAVKTRGVALKSLAQLGMTDYRRHCQLIATDAWITLARSRELPQDILLPKKAEERSMLRGYALESLRLIGDEGSITALRDARNWRTNGTAVDLRASYLMQLSYEVSEDIYWRVTGGREGDFYDPAERQSKPR